MTVTYTAEQVTALLEAQRSRHDALVGQLVAERNEARDAVARMRDVLHGWRRRAEVAETLLAGWRRSVGTRLVEISGQRPAAADTVVLQAVRDA